MIAAGAERIWTSIESQLLATMLSSPVENGVAPSKTGRAGAIDYISIEFRVNSGMQQYLCCGWQPTPTVQITKEPTIQGYYETAN